MKATELQWHLDADGNRILDSVDGDPQHPDMAYWQARIAEQKGAPEFICEAVREDPL